jgi:tetratricopeptide (TPR) repeat protein
MAATQSGESSTPLSAEDYIKKGIEARDLTERIFYFTKAIELKPDYAPAYNYRGITYHRKGDYNLAIQDFTKSIEIDPNYHHAYRNRGIDYYHLRDYEHALNDYNKAIDFNPSD